MALTSGRTALGLSAALPESRAVMVTAAVARAIIWNVFLASSLVAEVCGAVFPPPSSARASLAGLECMLHLPIN